jgi:hypothetical protein
MDARCARSEGWPAVRHRGKRLVVDGNERRGVLGDVASARSPPPPPRRQRRPRPADERRYRAELRGTKLERSRRAAAAPDRQREHGMRRGTLRGPDVDGAGSVRHGCARMPPEHVGKAQIGDEAAATRSRAILEPLDGVADKRVAVTVYTRRSPWRRAVRHCELRGARIGFSVLREREQVGSVPAGQGCCGRSVTTLILILFQDCSHCSKRRCTRALLSAHHL